MKGADFIEIHVSCNVSILCVMSDMSEICESSFCVLCKLEVTEFEYT
jgi:hypothetical protein